MLLRGGGPTKYCDRSQTVQDSASKPGQTQHSTLARAAALTSPQYSEMNSFFCTDSLMKVPQPATSDGASSKCWSQGGKEAVHGQQAHDSQHTDPTEQGALHLPAHTREQPMPRSRSQHHRVKRNQSLCSIPWFKGTHSSLHTEVSQHQLDWSCTLPDTHQFVSFSELLSFLYAIPCPEFRTEPFPGVTFYTPLLSTLPHAIPFS